MPQEFQVLQCYKCETFQVHQVKKTTKWQCKLCGEKQSLKKVYGRGTGSECRCHVQKLNTMRGELKEVVSYSQCNNDDRSDTDSWTQSGSDRWNTNIQMKSQQKEENKWNMFVDKDVTGDSDNEVDEDPTDSMFTTDAALFKRGKKRKRMNKGCSSNDYKETRRADYGAAKYRQDENHISDSRRNKPDNNLHGVIDDKSSSRWGVFSTAENSSYEDPPYTSTNKELDARHIGPTEHSAIKNSTNVRRDTSTKVSSKWNNFISTEENSSQSESDDGSHNYDSSHHYDISHNYDSSHHYDISHNYDSLHTYDRSHNYDKLHKNPINDQTNNRVLSNKYNSNIENLVDNENNKASLLLGNRIKDHEKALVLNMSDAKKLSTYGSDDVKAVTTSRLSMNRSAESSSRNVEQKQSKWSSYLTSETKSDVTSICESSVVTSPFQSKVTTNFDCVNKPMVPTFTVPVEPTFTKPVGPTFTTPGRPTFTTPGRPTFTTPGRPTFTTPGRPTFTTPGRPTFTKPVGPTFTVADLSDEDFDL